MILWGASAAPQPAQQRSDQGRKPVISGQIVAGRAKILPSLLGVRIPLSPPDIIDFITLFGFLCVTPIVQPINCRTARLGGAASEKASEPEGMADSCGHQSPFELFVR